MNNSEDYYIKNPEQSVKPFSKYNIFTIIAFLAYLLLIGSVFSQFVPIQTGNWFNIGMGKYVGLAAIFAIYSLFVKNYFVAFFISLFSAFFVFHEVIIFYDNYAIELGRELGSDGSFRLVFSIFSDAFNWKYGAYSALLGSLTSLIVVSIAWLFNTVFENRLQQSK